MSMKIRSFPIIAYFASVKMTILLLLLITTVSILGSFFPYLSPRLATQQPFTSWWFLSLLCLLALNIITCSLHKYPSIRAAAAPARKQFSASFVQSLENNHILKTGLDLDEVVRRISSFFSSLGYQIVQPEVQEPHSSCVCFHAEKGRKSRYGFYVTHLSILFILLGALIGSIYGFKGYLEIPVGEEKDVVMLANKDKILHLPFKIRCEDFHLENYEGSQQVKDYYSTLAVIYQEKTIFRQEIEVNHPLNFNGIKFYQSSYGRSLFNPEKDKAHVIVQNRETKTVLRELDVQVGLKYVISGHEDKMFVELTEFVPDFVIGASGKVQNRSHSMENPAVKLNVFQKDALLDSFWVFSRFPDIIMGQRKSPYHFIVSFPQTNYYTGLQVVKDPGIPLVYTGGILLCLGLCFVFFSSHRRYYILAEQSVASKKVTVFLAAKTNKNRMALRQDFAIIAQRIQEEVLKNDK